MNQKFKLPLMTAMSALVMGAYGFHKIEHDYFDEVRYPIRVEYAIIDSCIYSDRTTLSTSQFRNKKQICLCAYEKTVAEVSYSELDDNNAFFDTFTKNTNTCK